MSFDVSRLAEPISESFPMGEDVRTGRHVELYYRLKDARSAARADERNFNLSEPFRMSSAWTDVRALSIEILSTVSKDLEVLAWLCEAELRRTGFEGLARGFELTAQLVRRDFDALHSIDGDGTRDKVAPFAGLNGIRGEGALVQPVRLASLVAGGAFFRHSLFDFQMTQRPDGAERLKVLQEAVGEAGSAAMREHLGHVKRCSAAFADLTAAFDGACGPEAPPASHIRTVLEQVRLAIVNLTGLREEDVPAASAAVGTVSAEAGTGAATVPAAASGPVRSREEALDRLMEVARYFRDAEPHSPMASAIETLVARARLDFTELLAELIEDDNQRRAVLIMAGIKPESGSS